MSTFGRGVRYEMKKLSASVTGSGFVTILNVPSNANYFIFINYYSDSSGRSLRTILENGSVNGDQSGTGGTWTNYQDYNSTDDNTRYVTSGGRIDINAGTVYTLYYTEVYFGGQANY